MKLNEYRFHTFVSENLPQVVSDSIVGFFNHSLYRKFLTNQCISCIDKIKISFAPPIKSDYQAFIFFVINRNMGGSIGLPLDRPSEEIKIKFRAKWAYDANHIDLYHYNFKPTYSEPIINVPVQFESIYKKCHPDGYAKVKANI